MYEVLDEELGIAIMSVWEVVDDKGRFVLRTVDKEMASVKAQEVHGAAIEHIRIGKKR